MKILKRLARIICFPIGVGMLFIILPIGGIIWILSGSCYGFLIPFEFLSYAIEGETINKSNGDFFKRYICKRN